MNKILATFLFILIFPSLIYSQYSERVFYLRSVSIDAGANFQSWKIGDTKLLETSLPLQIVVPVSDQLSLSISNIPVMISRTAPDTTYTKTGTTITALASDEKRTINSLTDTRLGMKYIFLNNKAMLNVQVNIPTGKCDLEEDDFSLATQLGLGILKYRMPVLGQGFNVGGSCIYAIPLNKRNIFGFGLSYTMKSKYTPVKSIDYDPGDDFGLSLSYIYLPTADFKISLDVSYTNYFKDKISFTTLSDGVEKKLDLDFQSGYRMNFVVQSSLKTRSMLHWLTLQSKIRGDNQQQTLKVIDNALVYDEKNVSNGMQFDASYNALMPLSPYFTLNGQLLFRYYGGGQDNWNGIVIESDNSTVFSGGLGVRIMILDNLGLDLNGKYLSGKIKLDKEYDASGLDFFAKLNFLF